LQLDCGGRAIGESLQRRVKESSDEPSTVASWLDYCACDIRDRDRRRERCRRLRRSDGDNQLHYDQEAGTYQVPNPFTAATPGDCIVIKASNVTLDLHNSEMTGIGGSLPGTANVFIEGDGTSISNFTNGIELEGTNSFVEHLFARDNSGNGVWLHGKKQTTVSRISCDHNGVTGMLLDHSNHNRVEGLEASQSGKFGLWLDGSSFNIVDGSDFSDNDVGLYLGCSSGGPSGVKCKPGPQSSNNQIYGNQGALAVWQPNLGIAIDLGSLSNRIIGNDIFNDVTDDLLDENPNCGNNFWFANRSAISSPSCIQ
jgi:parallel beta-helix repeat protein